MYVRGPGICNWAQWPVDQALSDDSYFHEAGPMFREALGRWWEAEGSRLEYGTELDVVVIGESGEVKS